MRFGLPLDGSGNQGPDDRAAGSAQTFKGDYKTGLVS